MSGSQQESRASLLPVHESSPQRLPATIRSRQFFSSNWSVGDLVRFHTREKLLLLAHDRQSYDRLGHLVARAGQMTREELAATYLGIYSSALAKKPTVGQQVNVLQHIHGHFKEKLGLEERAEMVALIEAYGSGAVPLELPLGRLREHAIRHQIVYLAQQHYLALTIR